MSECAVVAFSAFAFLPEPTSNQSDLVLFSELAFARFYEFNQTK
jgi:hypothetical protein